jgi:hypothetical protein
MTGSPDAITTALIGYLADRVHDVVELVLPGGQGPAAVLARSLDTALAPPQIAAISAAKTALLTHLDQARDEFAAGRFTNTAHLAEAEADFQQLVRGLGGIAEQTQAALRAPAATAAGLGQTLTRLYDNFGTIHIVDLGAPGDQISHALSELETAIRGVDLPGLRARVEAMLGQMASAVQGLSLGQVIGGLDQAQAAIRDAVTGLDGALLEIVATVRAAFDRVRDALHSVRDALGTTDADGHFHFHVQEEIETFLNGLKTTLDNTIRPQIDNFKTSVHQVIDQVTETLNGVRDQIDGVKRQLQETVQGAVEQLRTLDIRGTLDAIRQTLENMLQQLGAISFDPVVDPVVAQIEQMRDQLRRIDVSKLNDVLRSALHVSVQVVTSIDFSTQITDALMQEFDRVLEIPNGAVDGLQERLDDALARLGALDPQVIVRPLADLFAPVTAALDQLQVDKLVAPLQTWYTQAQSQLDGVMPSALLAPVVEAYDSLNRVFAAISTDRLAGSLRETMSGITADLQRLEPAQLIQTLTDALGQAAAAIDGIAPAQLFAPLGAEFDRLTEALDRFDPAALLTPLGQFYGRLTAPLARLTDVDAARIGAAFAPLAALPAALDPQPNFEAAAHALAEARRALDGLSIGQILADVKQRYDAVQAALDAGNGPGELRERVGRLNPLQQPDLARTVAAFGALQAQLQAAFADTAPADLVSRFDAIHANVEGLAPQWVRQTPTAAAIREALNWANPATLGQELNQVYERLKEQWRALDPRIVPASLQALFDNLRNALAALSPATLAERVRGLMADLLPRLQALNPDVLANELRDVEGEVRTILAGLDPRPIIGELDSLANDVKTLFASLNPATVLSDLQAPLDAVKGIVQAFDPADFAAALEPIFSEIREMLSQINLRNILQPISDRLQALRGELEQALRRTETAFDQMLAAIPL